MMDFERAWLLAIFSAMLPSGHSERLPLGARDAPMEAFLDEFERTAPLDTRLGVRAALWVVTLAPLPWLGRPRLFAGLAAPEQVALLEQMSASPIYLLRELPMLLKVIACMGYAAAPRVQARVLTPR